MIDVRAACLADADYTLSAADVLEHEGAHGPLPRRAAVLVCTGWDAYRRVPDRYVGDMHFPGVSPAAARLLIERDVAGIGIDTLSIDAGSGRGLAHAPHHAAGRPLAARGARQPRVAAAPRGAARDRRSAARGRLGRACTPARAAARVVQA